MEEGHPLLDRGPQRFFQSCLTQPVEVEQTVGQFFLRRCLRWRRYGPSREGSLVLREGPIQVVGDDAYGFGAQSVTLREQGRSDLMLPQQPNPAQFSIDSVPCENHEGLDRDRGHAQGRHRRLGYLRHGKELGHMLVARLAVNAESSL
ncbi:hypothetical protein M271_18590 [Streptomyces rapamycinicus NRRL 5491]|nr:hypothetical protein M271_18590 [Streptomyces rapamycinicus NRRL 5491]